LNHFDALLFDFDGVLADTEPLHCQSWNRVLKPFGVQFGWEYYRLNCVGVADTMLVRRLNLGVNERELVNQKQTAFREAITSSPPIAPETRALIEELSAQYRLAVVSSSGRREVEPPLERTGIRPRFEFLVTFEDVNRVKPDPEPYLLASRRIGARRPLVIEDSNAGVASAQGAGLDLVRVSGAGRMPYELRAFLASVRA
jgi:beta-phosphoglucomutase